VRMESRLSGTDALRGDVDFADAFEGEEQLHEEGGRILFTLADDVADGVGDGGVEEDALDLHAGQVYADHLAGLKHDTPQRDPSLRVAPLGMTMLVASSLACLRDSLGPSGLA